MFVEDLLCEWKDGKAIIQQDSDPHNQYNKVRSNPTLGCACYILFMNKILLSSVIADY